MRGNKILTPCMQATGDCNPYNPCGPGCAVEWTNCDDEECTGKGSYKKKRIFYGQADRKGGGGGQPPRP